MAREGRVPPNGFIPLSQRPDLTTEESQQDTPLVIDKFSTTQRPKLKFHFTVTFKFRSPVYLRNEYATNGGELTDNLTFAMKQASRPNPTISYQDINHYNYRTKVATKMDYGSVMLTMYDDIQNYAHDLYEIYLKSVSPIANISKNDRTDLFKRADGPKNKGFNTENTVVGTGSQERQQGGSGSIGPLPKDSEDGIIENICIRHYYYSAIERRGGENPDVPEIQYVEYQFINPKIINMTLDELDMTQSEASTVQMNFAYDSVFIDSPRLTDALTQAEVKANEREARGEVTVEKNTISLTDLRGRISDIERLYRRARRLDTIPDIPVVDVIQRVFVPEISGTLADIEIPRPNIDLGFLNF